MNKQLVLYARVSLAIQTKNGAVSIDQQIEQMESLCQKNGWGIKSKYIDKENYRASQQPNKGKIVNPSGERSDRPQFLAMLEVIKTGRIDAVLCWRDDRIVRHPRVAVALEDALDAGDSQRNGRSKIEIHDATGVVLDRFTLSIKAAIWREENKRRAERSKMGKIGTLQEGRWPSSYRRYGYRAVKVEGKRGRIIELDPDTAPMVKTIYEMFDAGTQVVDIRKYLMNTGAQQIYLSLVKHEWSKGVIYGILRDKAYLGKATWQFSDGTKFELDIPSIIDEQLWERVQKRLDRNKNLSPRNAKGIYLLQGLIECSDCHHKLSVTRFRNYGGGYSYRCHNAGHNPHEGHPQPYNHSGIKLDWAIWRKIVDNVLKNPENIREQVEMKMYEAQSQYETYQSEILRIQQRMEAIHDERAFYQKKTAQGMITEEEFDRRMDETSEQIEYWNNELERLRSLTSDTERLRESVEYAEVLITKIHEGLDYLDRDPDNLMKLSEEERNRILLKRREIIRILVDKIT